jgi:DNA-directed RNA polymerase subunit K/omega
MTDKPMTRIELARYIASRNRRLAIEARQLAAEDLVIDGQLGMLSPVERARAIRQHARALVAGDDAWALVWIHRARRRPTSSSSPPA